MASWLRLFLLSIVRTILFSLVFLFYAHSFAEDKTAPLQVQSDQLIQPKLTRRDVSLDKIDTEDFEFTFFSGILSVEDFGANSTTGMKLAYHINEDIFIEGLYAQSTARESSYERGTSTTLFTEDERQVEYYNISLGYNLLPGESFLTRNTSFNSTVYVIAGVGNTTFAGSDRATINIGGGFRLLATDWLAFHIDVRDHIFNIDILGEDKTTNNLEVTIGVSAFF